MKTPREILLARHQAAEPKLDALRRAALGDLRPCETSPAPRPSFFAQLAEFFRLPKPALAGLALTWGIIILLYMASPEVTPMSSPASAPMAQRPAATREELRAQRRLFSELVGTPKDVEAEPPRFVPRPRGEVKPTYIYV
jgi:hypothetical protein